MLYFSQALREEENRLVNVCEQPAAACYLANSVFIGPTRCNLAAAGMPDSTQAASEARTIAAYRRRDSQAYREGFDLR